MGKSELLAIQITEQILPLRALGKTKSQNKKFKELYPSSQALKLYDQLIGFENTYASQALQQLTSSELFQLQNILAKVSTPKL